MPAGGIIAIVIVLYGYVPPRSGYLKPLPITPGAPSTDVLTSNSLINVFAVKWYGESEFWLALGKVLLIVGLIIYTFLTMLGVNPADDRFGFRYWKNPGSFAELYKTGSLGPLPWVSAVSDPSDIYGCGTGLCVDGGWRGGESPGGNAEGV